MAITVFDQHDQSRNLLVWLYSTPDGLFTLVDRLRDDRALAQGCEARDLILTAAEAAVLFPVHADAIWRAYRALLPSAGRIHSPVTPNVCQDGNSRDHHEEQDPHHHGN